MRHAKKLAGILPALVMALALTLTALAAQESNNTITINNAKAGETYSAYKMLELYVDDISNPTVYAYTAASEWEEFFDDANSSVWGTVLEKDTETGTYFQGKNGVNSEAEWSASSKLSAFAEAAAQYVKDNNIQTTITNTPTGTTAVLNTTECGYYLITSTLGTRAMIDTTPGNVTINEKNGENTIEKTVKEDSTGNFGGQNDVQIGDTVEFESVATIVPRSVNVKIHDTMTSGLSLNTDSITVYLDAGHTAPYTEAVIKTGAVADAGDTFTIEIPNDFAAAAAEDQKLYIVYTAKVNSAAVVTEGSGVTVKDQNNTTQITFGNAGSQESSTTTTTHKFTVHKYAAGQTGNLANAVFRVKKNDTTVNLVKLDDTNYRVADGTETGTPASHAKGNGEIETIAAGTVVSDFVTVASGDIVIWGVDSDGDYSIEEIQAPKGYNMISPVFKDVTVNADNSTKIDVENKSGSLLPSTGGIGTAIFYAAGSVLLVSASVLLIARKRMNAEK